MRWLRLLPLTMIVAGGSGCELFLDLSQYPRPEAPDAGPSCSCTGKPCGIPDECGICQAGSGCVAARHRVNGIAVGEGASDPDVSGGAVNVRVSTGSGEAASSNFQVKGVVVSP